MENKEKNVLKQASFQRYGIPYPLPALHPRCVLSDIDVTPYLENSITPTGKVLSYLNWARAWDILKTAYPDASWHVVQTEAGKTVYPLGAALMVKVHLTVPWKDDSDGKHTAECECALPVQKGQKAEDAVVNYLQDGSSPMLAGWVLNTARRALVKAIAELTGLGLSLWFSDSQRGMSISDALAHVYETHSYARLSVVEILKATDISRAYAILQKYATAQDASPADRDASVAVLKALGANQIILVQQNAAQPANNPQPARVQQPASAAQQPMVQPAEQTAQPQPAVQPLTAYMPKAPIEETVAAPQVQPAIQSIAAQQLMAQPATTQPAQTAARSQPVQSANAAEQVVGTPLPAEQIMPLETALDVVLKRGYPDMKIRDILSATDEEALRMGMSVLQAMAYSGVGEEKAAAKAVITAVKNGQLTVPLQ